MALTLKMTVPLSHNLKESLDYEAVKGRKSKNIQIQISLGSTAKFNSCVPATVGNRQTLAHM